jgi:nitrite reductase (NADH) small subunit
MGDFRTVCKVAELIDGAGKTVSLNGRLIAVFRVRDELFAIDDVCPHMGASLGEGEVEDGIVTCPWHAWRFRLADGAWADNPRIKIGRYPIRVVGDEVQIEM